MADQFLTLDGRPTVRVVRRYPHPIDTVWRAVTTSAHLGQWFPSPVDVDLRPGGTMHFRAFDGQPGAIGTVVEVEPPHRFTFTWGADRLSFELTPDGDGTIFTLTHSFADRYGAASFATGWDVCLTRLRGSLAGQPPPPPDRGISRHEALVHEFGLDRAEVTEADGRWTVRVERQLTCPADVAWDLWRARDPGEQGRVELGPGTGHGARLTLTVTGRDPADREAAVRWSSEAAGDLAARAADWAKAQPVQPD